MLKFNIFGIPVVVEPWFWLVSFMLGNGIYEIQHNGQEGMVTVGVWIVVVFVSVLVHELGHAITGHKLGGGRVWIKLWAFGGLAYQEASRFTRKNKAIMILMGPGAGFLLFGLTTIASFLLLGPAVTIGLLKITVQGLAEGISHLVGLDYQMTYSHEFVDFYGDTTKGLQLDIFHNFFYVNFFWGLINLFPIYPLDGGQLLNLYQKSPKKVHLIGIITSIAVAVFGATIMGSQYMAMMFGYFAFTNFLAYQESKY